VSHVETYENKTMVLVSNEKVVGQWINVINISSRLLKSLFTMEMRVIFFQRKILLIKG
jgi:hypothetical protein